MKKFVLAIMTLCLSLALLGCATNNNPTESIFELGIDELNNIQVNKPFQITGYLLNKSNQKWNISHGAGMFTYEVYDSEGNTVRQGNNMKYRNDIGYTAELKPKESYRDNGEGQRSKEFYEFIITTPGTYFVKTKAQFRITKDEDNFEFDINTNELHEFIVKE